MALSPLSARFQSLPLQPTIKLGPSSADSLVGGWACARSRPLWVSPTNSPVRLGVSPAAASTPMGVFIQRFEALFPCSGALGCVICHLVHQLLPGWPAIALPTWLHDLPQCWVLLQLPPCHVSTVPCHQSLPPYRSGWMCFLYLLGCRTSIQFDFLSVLVAFCF